MTDTSAAPCSFSSRRRVLMVAFHFPPLAGSSGIQRSLRFVQQLPSLGWEPLVLTAAPCAYERTSVDLLTELPPDLVVRRAFALDAARHLSIAGRHLSKLARPDRWMSWQFDAVRQGLRMIREFRPDVIWSTYPIATAHRIASQLQRRSGLPWVADFRDPMAQPNYPRDTRQRQAFSDIEADAIQHARFSTFTTPGAARMYRQRYPERAERVVVLENGYDEESFAVAERGSALLTGPLVPGLLTLLHSGIVYPSERDPTQLFEALGLLRQRGMLPSGRLQIRFRAAVHDDVLRGLAERYNVADVIELAPSIDYRDALAEMLRADALLVMQAANCNEQIPAKLYEYLRADRPILCLSDPAGDTASTLRHAGVDSIAHLDRATDIADLLGRWMDGRLTATRPTRDAVVGASRSKRTEALGCLLDHAARQT